MKLIPLIFLIVIFCLHLGLSSAHGGTPFFKVQEVNGIRYVSGGIGLDERNALKSVEKDYNLKLVFAALSGNYLSDIQVVVEDITGRKLIETTSNGPWLYTNLPQGRYKIVASFSDQKKVKMVDVEKSLNTILFHWKI